MKLSNTLQIVIDVLVAAFICGLTNYLAIKMLFLPRRQWTIAGRKVPFTPGVIPKRRDEIARSLGKVVGQYLVTSDGLRQMLRGERIQNRLEDKLREWLAAHAQKGETIEAIILRYVDQERYEQLVSDSERWSQRALRSLLQRWWTAGEWKSAPIGNWTGRLAMREELPRQWSEWLLAEAVHELESPRGEEFLRDLVVQFLERGGWLGVLAELMADSNKIALRLQAMLVQLLKSPDTKRRFETLIAAKLAEVEQFSLEQLIEKLSGMGALEWLEQNAQSLLQPERWPRKLVSSKIEDWWPDYQGWIEERIPAFSRWLLVQAEQRVDSLVKAIDLPRIVEREVIRFPVRRLEELILNVTGKEFRAITWFGAVIGGLIGFVQSILMLYVYGG